MIILNISAYVYITEYKETHRLNTGYGHATWDISKNIALNGDESFVFTYQPKKAIETNGVKINKLTVGSLLRNLKIKNISLYLRTANRQKKFKWALHDILHHFCEGSLSAYINQVKPDCIVIHGVGAGLISSLIAVTRSRIPFIIVLHGLNACNDSVGFSAFQKNYEIGLLKWLNERSVRFAVVSSGTCRDLSSIYGIPNIETVKVVLNGITVEYSIEAVSQEQAKKELFGEGFNRKVILSVSSLSKRKNQISLVRALGHLNDIERNEYLLVIVGDGVERKNIENAIHELKLEKQVLLTGRLDRKAVNAYYRASDLTVIVSLSEGFGLPIIESYSQGTPVLIYEDLDAVEDLFESQAMYKCSRYTDQQLLKDIKTASLMDWDRK